MWRYPKIISHRGGGYLAPENTLAAMEIALYFQNRAVEYDVMLSKDSLPIIMHDSELGRTVPGTGNISDLTFEELTQLDAGAWWNQMFQSFQQADPTNLPKSLSHINVPEVVQVIKQLPKSHYLDEKVPSFQSVVHYCQLNQIWMNIEIKPAPGFEQTTGEIVSRLTKEFFHETLSSEEEENKKLKLPLFSSFDYVSLMAAKTHAPEIPRSFLAEEIPMNWRAIMSELEAENLHCDHKHLTQDLAMEIKQSGYGLACYTVNDLARAEELFSWGVDAIFTDRVDLFK
jgi:glycerophosphoryl diester phosphodiesterase